MPAVLKIIGAVVLMLLGAALLVVVQRGSGINPSLKGDLSFADFTGIILTALGVILAALALLLGVVAVVGWSTFESMVQRKSNEYLEKRFSPEDERYVRLIEDIKEDVRREIALRRVSDREPENASPYDEAAL
jgi:hypothetical protein